MTCTVYLVTHKGSGRGYVGFTRGNVDRRWARHQFDAACGSEHPLHTALRDEGAESFHIRSLFTAPYPDVLRLEAAEIARRRTYAPHGFNGTRGLIATALATLRSMETQNG